MTLRSPREQEDHLAKTVRLELPLAARRLDTVPISEHVYQVIRDAICEGRFEPFERLVQNQLAEQLEVSRTPIRDALLRLSQEGLIDSVGARGYIVRELTPRDILDVYEVRIPLETLAADISFPELTPADISEAQRLNERISHPATEEDNFDLNRRFHSSLITHCPNTLLVRTLRSIWDLPVARRIFRQYVSAQDTVTKMVGEHAKILEAVIAIDRELYVSLVYQHLLKAQQDTARWLESQPRDWGMPGG
jgi:DNA-binding GntR family transcriptional regulator